MGGKGRVGLAASARCQPSRIPPSCAGHRGPGGSDAADTLLFKTAAGDKGFFPAVATSVSAWDFFHS